MVFSVDSFFYVKHLFAIEVYFLFFWMLFQITFNLVFVLIEPPVKHIPCCGSPAKKIVFSIECFGNIIPSLVSNIRSVKNIFALSEVCWRNNSFGPNGSNVIRCYFRISNLLISRKTICYNTTIYR